MNFLKSDQIPQNAWSNLLATSPFASPFQTPAFYDFLKESGGSDAKVFGLSVSGELKALMVIAVFKEPGIRGYFSRRGIVFGGPLLHNISREELEFFLKNVVKSMRGKTIYLETRNFFDYSIYRPAFDAVGWKYLPWLNFLLPTQSKEQVEKGISDGRRRQISKAILSGARWTEPGSMDDVRAFYDILLNQSAPHKDQKATARMGVLRILL